MIASSTVRYYRLGIAMLMLLVVSRCGTDESVPPIRVTGEEFVFYDTMDIDYRDAVLPEVDEELVDYQLSLEEHGSDYVFEVMGEEFTFEAYIDDEPTEATSIPEPVPAVEPERSAPPARLVALTEVGRVEVPNSYLMGQFDPRSHEAFVAIAPPYAARAGMYLRRDAYQAFKAMRDAAAQDGVLLSIVSATRPFHHQKRIWEQKWTGKRKVDGDDLSRTERVPLKRALKILEYSSMPGTSRHHWGTDIDLNALNNRYFERGKGLKVYNWLQANASSYGYCQVYTARSTGRLEGYNEEKWHWSFTPVSNQLTAQYRDRLTDDNIGGFVGSQTATDLDVVRNYVLGISDECQ